MKINHHTGWWYWLVNAPIDTAVEVETWATHSQDIHYWGMRAKKHLILTEALLSVDKWSWGTRSNAQLPEGLHCKRSQFPSKPSPSREKHLGRCLPYFEPLYQSPQNTLDAIEVAYYSLSGSTHSLLPTNLAGGSTESLPLQITCSLTLIGRLCPKAAVSSLRTHRSTHELYPVGYDRKLIKRSSVWEHS